MIYKIILDKIKIFGFHGVYEEEKNNGQNFEIDIILTVEVSTFLKDDIKSVINYSDIFEEVKNIFNTKKFNLIEVLAYNIANSINQKFDIKTTKVLISKPNAPMNGNIKSVKVEVELDA